jgi:hypothetical protein
MASTTETKGAEATAAMAPGTPFFAARFTISMHFHSPFYKDISLDSSYRDVAQDISFVG